MIDSWLHIVRSLLLKRVFIVFKSRVAFPPPSVRMFECVYVNVCVVQDFQSYGVSIPQPNIVQNEQNTVKLSPFEWTTSKPNRRKVAKPFGCQ